VQGIGYRVQGSGFRVWGTPLEETMICRTQSDWGYKRGEVVKYKIVGSWG